MDSRSVKKTIVTELYFLAAGMITDDYFRVKSYCWWIDYKSYLLDYIGLQVQFATQIYRFHKKLLRQKRSYFSEKAY